MATIHTEKWKDYKAPDRGVGDTIARITKATGIKAVVDKVSEAIDADCGCEERRERLNQPDILINKIFYSNKKR
jgi:hypothetical protein